MTTSNAETPGGKPDHASHGSRYSRRTNQLAPIGQRLLTARKQEGLTQVVAAERLGIKQNTLSAIEQGATRIAPTVLARAARAYGVTLAWLVTGESDETLTTQGEPAEAMERSLADLYVAAAQMRPSDRQMLLRFALYLLADHQPDHQPNHQPNHQPDPDQTNYP